MFTNFATDKQDYSPFRYCKKLSNVVIGNSVKSIGEYAFANTGLSKIDIPNSVTIICDYAFNECLSLAEVNMGDSMTVRNCLH